MGHPDNKSPDARRPAYKLATLHRTRFFPWSPQPVVAIESCGDGSLVAVAHENSRVEVWDMQHLAPMAVVPPEKDTQASSLSWVYCQMSRQWRLFLGRLDGMVYEVDLVESRLRDPTDSYGGAVWALKASGGDEPLLVAGCDDGSIRVFAVQHPHGLEYQRHLSKVEGKVLSLAWNKTGSVLVSGTSSGCIHCWEATTGREIRRITAGGPQGGQVDVWSLLVLEDGTLVSGTSEGAVQVWDSRFGTLLVEFHQPTGPVLALAASPDGRRIYAAGVDPQVHMFRQVSSSTTAGADQLDWVYSEKKTTHTHDVRSLCVCMRGAYGPTLISGGVDGRLVLYSAEWFDKVSPSLLSRSPQRPQVVVSRSGGSGEERNGLDSEPWAVVTQDHAVDFYSMGRTCHGASTRPPGPDEGSIFLRRGPRHLARLELTSKAGLRCSAISQDHQLLACSTQQEVKVFRIEQAAAGKLRLHRHMKGTKLSSAGALVFHPQRHIVYMVTNEGCLVAHDLDNKGEVMGKVDLRSLKDLRGSSPARLMTSGYSTSLPVVSHMNISDDGQWLAVGGWWGVRLVRLPGLEVQGVLPPQDDDRSPLGAMTFTSDGSQLVVVTASKRISTYSVASGGVCEWSRLHHEQCSSHLRQLPGCVLGVCAGSRPGDKEVMVYTAASFCHVHLNKPVGELLMSRRQGRRAHARGLQGATPQPSIDGNPSTTSELAPNSHVPQKRRPQPLGSGTWVSHDGGFNCRTSQARDPLLCLSFLAPNEVFTAERPWREILEALPPPMKKHKYGGGQTIVRL